MNPPYGREIGAWVEKAARSQACAVVALLPARTDTAWFHLWVAPFAELQFLRGRIRFDGAGGARSPAPFPSVVAIYGCTGVRWRDWTMEA